MIKRDRYSQAAVGSALWDSPYEPLATNLKGVIDMQQTYGLERMGLINPQVVYRNMSPAWLTEQALLNQEGVLSDTGALVVRTGKYTGRAPDDKFIVDTPSIHDYIAWNNINRPISKEKFNALKSKMLAYFQNRPIYLFDGFAGADEQCRKKFRVVNELASECLFIRNLLIRPTAEELAQYGEPDFTILVAPGFQCNPQVDGTHSQAAILVDYESRTVLIAGTRYAGEIKKSVFSVMNYFLPNEGVLPMHCSANMDPVTKETAIFFGLSGTGKTTLSADPNRKLIGDDEHGWSSRGIFNFEGGCYAKCINLNPEKEPYIYNAIKAGTLVENVVLDEDTRHPNYFDSKITENTRAGYPIDYIPNAAQPDGHHLPHGRQFRRLATHFTAQQRSGHVPLRHGLYVKSRRYGTRHYRTDSDLLDPLRRTLHALGAGHLRRYARRTHRKVQYQGLPGQYGLDRRPLWHRQPHGPEIHAGHDHGRPERLSRRRPLPP